MLSLDDNRWQSLQGGYRVPFDARPFLAKLAANVNVPLIAKGARTNARLLLKHPDVELLKIMRNLD
jgi:hypothetical protein